MNSRGSATVSLTALVCALLALIVSIVHMYRSTIEMSEEAHERIIATKELTKAVRQLAAAQEKENARVIGSHR